MKAKTQLEKKLLHYTGKAIHDYKMLQHGDRVLVAVSGGKDSLTLLHLLRLLQIRAKSKFTIRSFTLDQGQPGWDDSKLKEYLAKLNVDPVILNKDTYSIVKQKISPGQTYCSLCSRLRRGIIYNYAKQHGFNKIALGHHRDDAIQTLLMSILYNGEISAMPPKLLTNDQKLIVIRPMIYCQEVDLAAFAASSNFPIIPCNLCGNQENLARKRVAKLINDLAKYNPKIPSNILHAISNIQASQLMDHKFWDFKNLEKCIK